MGVIIFLHLMIAGWWAYECLTAPSSPNPPNADVVLLAERVPGSQAASIRLPIQR